MNRHRFATVSLLMLTASGAAAEEATKISGHAWVTVKNPSPIRSGNASFSFGDTCSINRPGTATKVAEDTARGTVLIRYSLPQTAYGALCPSGTLFEVSAEDFAAMNAQADAANAADKSEEARIRQLLLYGVIK